MLFVILLFSQISQLQSKEIPEMRIGGLFGNENEAIAFNVATENANSKYLDPPFLLIPESLLISKHNAFNVASKACHLLEKGVISIFGPNSAHSSTYLQMVLDRKEIPHIETQNNIPQRHNCLLNLHPHPSALSQAYIDLIVSFNWEKLVVIYENEENLFRISALLNLQTHFGRSVRFKLLTLEDGSYRPVLKTIKNSGDTNFIIDCSTSVLEEVLKQAQQVGMMSERYNYLITDLDFQLVDLTQYQYSGTNITGFRMIDRQRLQNFGFELTLKTALIVDAVNLLHEAIMDFTLSKQFIIKSKKLFCNDSDNWKYGHTIVNYMKGKTIQGLSGIVKFDTEGFRRDFILEILELSSKGLSKIGDWASNSGLNINRRVSLEAPRDEVGVSNKTFIVITCLTTPYGMLKETTAHLTGNDRFEGFGIDLIEELSKMLGFNYTITIQEDGYNGNYNATTKEWNGLIGAILRGEADLAIADLTITAERESAVDFTLQFMNLGISILYKKPKPVPPSLFMFVSPFSRNVWLLLGGTYLVVSLCFFVMGRLSPSEWTNPYPCLEEPEYLINQFSIRNSFWFTVGSLMQQGTEIAPISISTRTGAGVWWFFTLIMVSSYTANLAAFLTVETLVTPFSNVKELAEQSEIKFGAKKEGATANFFKNSGNDSIRQKIWHYMYTHEEDMPESNDEGVERVKNENYAFFMESTTIEYETERHCSLASVGAPLDDKGYAIAMRKNSSYRSDLSAAILKLQETGKIAALKEKWWKEKRGASNCGAKGGGNAATPLNLQNVGGVFLVLFLGTILGFIGSLIELSFRIYSKTKNSNISFKEEFKNELKFFVRFKKNVRVSK